MPALLERPSRTQQTPALPKIPGQPPRCLRRPVLAVPRRPLVHQKALGDRAPDTGKTSYDLHTKWVPVIKQVIKKDYAVGYLLLALLARTSVLLNNIAAVLGQRKQVLPTPQAANDILTTRDTTTDPAAIVAKVSSDAAADAQSASIALTQLFVYLGLPPAHAAALAQQHADSAPVTSDMVLGLLDQIRSDSPVISDAPADGVAVATVAPPPAAAYTTPQPAIAAGGATASASDNTPMYSNVLDGLLSTQISSYLTYPYGLTSRVPAGPVDGGGAGGDDGGSGGGNGPPAGPGGAGDGDPGGVDGPLSPWQLALLTSLLRAAIGLYFVLPAAACVYTSGVLLNMLAAWLGAERAVAPTVDYRQASRKKVTVGASVPELPQRAVYNLPQTESALLPATVPQAEYLRLWDSLSWKALQLRNLELEVTAERRTNQRLRNALRALGAEAQLLSMVQRHLSDASSQSSALIARAAALEQQAAAAAAERDALAAALRRERDVARALRESRDVLQSDLTHSFVCLTRSSGRCDSLEEDYDKLHREYQELIKLFDQEADLVSRYRREVELQDAELQNEKQTTRVLREQLQSEMEQRERLEGRVMVLSADTREMEQQLEITSLACGQLQSRLAEREQDCLMLRDELEVSAHAQRQLQDLVLSERCMREECEDRLQSAQQEASAALTQVLESTLAQHDQLLLRVVQQLVEKQLDDLRGRESPRAGHTDMVSSGVPNALSQFQQQSGLVSLANMVSSRPSTARPTTSGSGAPGSASDWHDQVSRLQTQLDAMRKMASDAQASLEAATETNSDRGCLAAWAAAGLLEAARLPSHTHTTTPHAHQTPPLVPYSHTSDSAASSITLPTDATARVHALTERRLTDKVQRALTNALGGTSAGLELSRGVGAQRATTDSVVSTVAPAPAAVATGAASARVSAMASHGGWGSSCDDGQSERGVTLSQEPSECVSVCEGGGGVRTVPGLHDPAEMQPTLTVSNLSRVPLYPRKDAHSSSGHSTDDSTTPLAEHVPAYASAVVAPDAPDAAPAARRAIPGCVDALTGAAPAAASPAPGAAARAYSIAEAAQLSAAGRQPVWKQSEDGWHMHFESPTTTARNSRAELEAAQIPHPQAELGAHTGNVGQGFVPVMGAMPVSGDTGVLHMSGGVGVMHVMGSAAGVMKHTQPEFANTMGQGSVAVMGSGAGVMPVSPATAAVYIRRVGVAEAGAAKGGSTGAVYGEQGQPNPLHE